MRQALDEPDTRAGLDALYADEVIPGFARHGMEAEARANVARTIERFANPFLDHRIADIHSGHTAKIATRIGGFVEWIDRTCGDRLPMIQLRAIMNEYAPSCR